jgi:hypothetical protein
MSESTTFQTTYSQSNHVELDLADQPWNGECEPVWMVLSYFMEGTLEMGIRSLQGIIFSDDSIVGRTEPLC